MTQNVTNATTRSKFEAAYKLMNTTMSCLIKIFKEVIEIVVRLIKFQN